MIYLDNAATTMHKPQAVIDAVVNAMNSIGNAGRGANTASLGAARLIYETRKGLPECLARKARSRSYSHLIPRKV